jgi:hypothetical protein
MAKKEEFEKADFLIITALEKETQAIVKMVR